MHCLVRNVSQRKITKNNCCSTFLFLHVGNNYPRDCTDVFLSAIRWSVVGHINECSYSANSVHYNTMNNVESGFMHLWCITMENVNNQMVFPDLPHGTFLLWEAKQSGRWSPEEGTALLYFLQKETIVRKICKYHLILDIFISWWYKDD